MSSTVYVSIAERAQRIDADLNALETRINAAELTDEAIPRVLEILEEFGHEIKRLEFEIHGKIELCDNSNYHTYLQDSQCALQKVQKTWEGVYSVCIDREISKQNTKPQGSRQNRQNHLQYINLLSCKEPLSSAQKQHIAEFKGDLEDEIEKLTIQEQKRANFFANCRALITHLTEHPEETKAAQDFFATLDEETQKTICRKLFALFNNRVDVDHLSRVCFDNRFTNEQKIQAMNACMEELLPKEGEKKLSFSHSRALVPLDKYGLGALSILPNELLEYLLSFLALEDLGSLCRVCKGLNDIRDANVLDKAKLDYQIRNGFFTVDNTLHLSVPITCVQMINNCLFIGHEYGGIRIFRKNHKGWNEINSKMSHIYAVSCMHIAWNRLYSGDIGGLIKVWDLNTKPSVPVKTTRVGVIAVTCLQVVGNRLYSASEDGIKVWDLNNMKCLLSIPDCWATRTIKVVGNRIFFNNWPTDDIGVANLKTKRISSLQGHVNEVTCLEVIDDRLFSGSCDGYIKVWDLNSMQCLGTGLAEQPVYSLQALGNYLIASTRTNIKIFDPKNMECIATLRERIVTPIQVIGEQLYYVFSDSQMKILNFSSTPSETLSQIAEKFGVLSTGEGFALDHFKMLPNKIKDAIYGELYKICSFENDYWRCAEYAFLNPHGPSISNPKRAEAIHRYLLKQIVQLLEQKEFYRATEEFMRLPEDVQQRVSGTFFWQQRVQDLTTEEVKQKILLYLKQTQKKS
jgi:hypothetical protein